jgi:hypothetical protein
MLTEMAQIFNPVFEQGKMQLTGKIISHIRFCLWQALKNHCD